MLNYIRRKIGLYYLRKEQPRIDPGHKMVNLPEARHIGVIYTLDGIPDYDKVSQFVTSLQQDHKEVKALGFVKSKALIERFLPKLSYDFFSRRDLTWFYKPIHDTVKDFIARDFDLLINLSVEDTFPLKYISAMSHAFCRVGRYSEENIPYYDLMIDLKPAMTVDDYFIQIRHYLTIIKTNENHTK
jgi:hypothetical protein